MADKYMAATIVAIEKTKEIMERMDFERKIDDVTDNLPIPQLIKFLIPTMNDVIAKVLKGTLIEVFDEVVRELKAEL